MSVFIELLRTYKDELEHLHAHDLTTDMRCAISTLLRCKTEQQGCSQ
ncbi:hypothetical protein N5C36_12370 [Shewanella xiamenensis]|nr:hypothetical protein [Shewanella xiamenensis]MDH1314876.1 hypothetical protein [Shewanella xiamenensis]